MVFAHSRAKSLVAVSAGALVVGAWAATSIAAPPATPGPAPRIPGPQAEGPRVLFTDATRAAGIVTQQSMHMPGQACGDFDRDGLVDLYVTGGALPNQLFRNRGNGTFELSPLSDSIALDGVPSGGAVFADYDNDGWLDLYVLNDGPNVLYRNENGTAFVDVTDVAGVGDDGVGTTGSWGDFDNDGHLDLYVANWFCLGCSDASRDALFHNNGDGTFTDATAVLGLAAYGFGFVASFLDYDNDGDLDIYVVNDKAYSSTPPPPHPGHNVLFRNDGPGDSGGWVFTDVSEETGADSAVDGMGLAIADFDNDLDLDMYFSNAGPQVFLENQTSQGSPVFVDASIPTGTDVSLVGWGTLFIDIDNDGWRDLYLATSNAAPAQSNRTFLNLRNGAFRDVTEWSGAVSLGFTMGVASLDFDGDGGEDMVIGDLNGSYRLYRNRRARGGENNWIRVALEGRGPVNRDAIGARVYIETVGGLIMMQEVKCGSSLGSGNEMTLHFGLGPSTIKHLNVVWPNGRTEIFYDWELPVNSTWKCTYPGPG